MTNIHDIHNRSGIKSNFRRFASVLHVRDAALTGYLISILEQQDIPLPGDVQTKLYDAADKFQVTEAGRHFLKRVAGTRPSVPK